MAYRRILLGGISILMLLLDVLSSMVCSDTRCSLYAVVIFSGMFDVDLGSSGVV